MDTTRIRKVENDNERILDYTVEQRDFLLSEWKVQHNEYHSFKAQIEYQTRYQFARGGGWHFEHLYGALPGFGYL